MLFMPIMSLLCQRIFSFLATLKEKEAKLLLLICVFWCFDELDHPRLVYFTFAVLLYVLWIEIQDMQKQTTSVV